VSNDSYKANVLKKESLCFTVIESKFSNMPVTNTNNKLEGSQ